jgi:multidrug efflux pump subunit AcrB
MKLPEYSLQNRTVILFATFLLGIGGILAYFNLGKLEDPEFTVKTALVVTPYPGASPHEVEQQVTRVIEAAVQATDEVEHIRSESRAGLSMVYVDLLERNRSNVIEQLWDLLRRRVGRCQRDLPPGAGPSQVHDDYSDVFGIFLALTGDGFSYAELKDYVNHLKRELMLVKDVERIMIFGELTECIRVNISKNKCAGLGIPPRSIVGALRRQNEIVDAKAIENGVMRIRIGVSGSFHSPEDVGNLLIQQTNGGEQILLKDLATITREYIQPHEPFMRFNGKEAIGISIAAASRSNVVEMGEAVQRRIDEMMADFPIGLELHGVYYQSKFVQGAIRDFLTNLIESVAIVLGVLLVTMGLRSGLVMASSLILTILGTLVIMLVWKIDLHNISIGAIILVMGMIVDNAIVVTDSALVRLSRDEDPYTAIAESAGRNAWPLLGTTVIACLAFFPIYMSPANGGEFCAALFQVVSIALLVSWILAMTQSPVFCHYLLKAQAGGGRRTSRLGWPLRVYSKFLDLTLRRRAITLSILVGLLILSVIGFQFVPKMFFADSDKAQFFIDYRRPVGTRIQEVSTDLKRVEEYLQNQREVKNFATCIGAGAPRFACSLTPEPENPFFGQLVVNVHDYKQIDALKSRLETWFVENLPAGEPHIWKYISGPKADYKVEARFSGPDPQKLRELAEQAKEIMRKDTQARNVCDDWRERVMIWNAAYSQQKARMANVERCHLGESLMCLTDGFTVSYYREKDELIPIQVTYRPFDSGSLPTVPIWGNGSSSVPLGQIVSRSRLEWEDPIIHRYDRRRAIRAQCDPVPGVTSEELLNRLRPNIEAIPLPVGYTLEWEGEYELSAKNNAAVQKFLPVTLIVMVFILVALFNSIRRTLIVILVVLFATVGMTAGLLCTGQPFGFLAMLGAYGLIGMLIKNAVVLLAQIQSETRAGKTPLHAVKESSLSRMRPVMLASITTILGMVPLLTDPVFVSMAVTIMFGLAFATVLTLIVVPVLYTLLFRIRTSERSDERTS